MVSARTLARRPFCSAFLLDLRELWPDPSRAFDNLLVVQLLPRRSSRASFCGFLLSVFPISLQRIGPRHRVGWLLRTRQLFLLFFCSNCCQFGTDPTRPLNDRLVVQFLPASRKRRRSFGVALRGRQRRRCDPRARWSRRGRRAGFAISRTRTASFGFAGAAALHPPNDETRQTECDDDLRTRRPRGKPCQNGYQARKVK